MDPHQPSVSLVLLNRIEELEEAGRLYEHTKAHSVLGICTARADGKVVEANPAFLCMVGISDQEFQEQGLDWLRLTPPEYWEADRLATEMLLCGGESTVVEKEFFRRDGTRVPVAVTVTLKPGSQEEAIVFALDLTALRQTEAAFRSSQDLQQRLVEQNPDAILTLTSGLIDYANPAAVRLYGARGPEDLLGRDTLDFLLKEERDQVVARRNHAGSEDKCEHIPLVQRIQRLDGGEAIVEGKGLLLEQNPPRLMLVLRDITLRLKMEEALRQSQRLESLGVLASGIAHDFNNILAALAGNLDFAKEAAGADTPAGPYLANAGLAIERASSLVNQLLAYAGQSPGSPIHLDLNTSVEDMIRVLSGSLPPRISLRRDLSQGLPSILADATQIQQVIMNLITNAADAIGEEKGEIHLGTHRETLVESECRVGFAGQDLYPGAFLCLRVRDTGCGMSPEVIARIFDPFFTTKETGHGLGLSALRGIVKSHGGGIRITSQRGVGTTFEVYFPEG